jgi:hypothetical protein
MLKFFRFPFAIAGDKTPIPDPSQVTGAVSYSTGFGPDYELDPLVDPDGKDVPRDETNALFFDVTNAIREYQTFGTPDFITSGQNGGVPFAYDRNARVVWTDGDVYESRVNSNTDLPTVTASWRKVSGTNDQTLLIAVAGGTANALTASFSPSLTSLTNGVPFFIRCAAPNTVVAPTLNVDGLGAKTICKGANVALAAGDLAGSGFWAILQYDVTLDKFVLANPARGLLDFSAAIATNGWQRLPSGLIIQWGGTPVLGPSNTPVTFPIPFPSACFNVNLQNMAATNIVTGVTGVSSTGFLAWASTGSNLHRYVAIGF